MQNTRSTLVHNLLQLHPQDRKKLDATIFLAARILSTLSIGEIDNCLPPRKTVLWDHGTTLLDSILTEFLGSTIAGVDKIPKNFKAANLEKFANIKVHWTSNLADQLSMGVDEVRIFHHVSFRELHSLRVSGPPNNYKPIG